MRTAFRARELYAGILRKTAREYQIYSPARPERFMEKMYKNRGNIGAPDEEGLQRKNPVIVALGDSVTAGHFESLITWPPEQIQKFLLEIQKKGAADAGTGEIPPLEITDARESYLEKFRYKLIDKYERTSVSTINAGIAGDNLISMEQRVNRDVIRYQPDLVLVNGSLNWEASLGTAEEYKMVLKRLVQRIKSETEADIILLTPNGDLPNRPMFGENAPIPTTKERVEKIREIAEEEKVCLADVYDVWEKAREAGCPWEEMLANRVNHPGVEGHEVYAEVLMKLFERR